MAVTPAQWFAAAHEAYGEVLVAMARHGIRPDRTLRFVAARTPTPYYEPATVTIGIGMPDPATVGGRLYWLYAARVLGCRDVDEAVARQLEQLPFMVAHELVHHLRHHHGAVITNDFWEEQVANVVALAFVGEHPIYGARLPAMQAGARRAMQTLSLLAPDVRPLVAGFRLSGADVLLDMHELSAVERRELRLAAEATGVPLATLLVQAGIATAGDVRAAEALRAAAEQHFNAVYMDDLLQYALFHMAWIAAYLDGGQRPSLARSIEQHLLAARADEATRTGL